MENTPQDMIHIREAFQSCQKLLTALGDETRQYLLYVLLGSECHGSRAVDLAAKTNLSRSAVSHHIQILKQAGIVNDRKEGTFVYYYLDPKDSDIQKLIALFSDIGRIMQNAPDRSGDE